MPGLVGACLCLCSISVCCWAAIFITDTLYTYSWYFGNFIFADFDKRKQWEGSSSDILEDNNTVSVKMNFLGWLFFFLFIGFLVYFFGGMLVMKMRGAEGIQIIPHYTFWITLPFKLKVNKWSSNEQKTTKRNVHSFCFQSGITYCINGCRTQSEGYEEIWSSTIIVKWRLQNRKVICKLGLWYFLHLYFNTNNITIKYWQCNNPFEKI